MNEPTLERLLWWRRGVSRIVLGSLFLGLALVVTSYGISWLVESDNRDFHQRVVAPALARSLESGNHSDEVDRALNAWLERQKRLGVWLEVRFIGYLILAGSMLLGTSISVALDHVIKRHVARADRPPFSGTGKVTRELAREGKPITATTRPFVRHSRRWIPIIVVPAIVSVLLWFQFTAERPWEASLIFLGAALLMFALWLRSDLSRTCGNRQAIEIDPVSGRIEFRCFRFVSHFAQNPIRAKCTLHAREILGVEALVDSQGRAVTVRTTQGRVTLFDQLENFDKVVALLADLAETNRLDPAAYRTALSREPKIKTPWWGWLLLVGLCTAVVSTLWLLIVRPV